MLKNWADDPDSDIYEQCAKFYGKVSKAYEEKSDLEDSNDECWAIFNAEADCNVTYNGISDSYIPIVRDCVRARAKRAIKQCFPTKYRHLDVLTSDEEQPHAQMAILEHYIRECGLKSIIRSMFMSGDITGQWSLYVDWLSEYRDIGNLIRQPKTLEDGEVEDPTEDEEVVENKRIYEERPDIFEIATEDLVVLPSTATDINKADLVSVILRMSKNQVEDYIEDGIFILPDDTEVSAWIDGKKPDKDRADDKRSKEAGVKPDKDCVLIYEVTARLKDKKLYYIYYAGEDSILGIIEAPQWNQKRPVISGSVQKVKGSFFGKSEIEPVKKLQWALNDFHNMGQDSAMYSLMPIIMTDPLQNPNFAMMVLGLAAVWPVNPDHTKPLTFPQLWKDAVGYCQSIKAQIYESMETNEMMMGKMPGGRKNAGVAASQQQEQATAVIDLAERMEEIILNPLLEMMFEYDCQFRDKEATVLVRGEIGIEASMKVVPPMQWGTRYYFNWIGTEYVMSMGRMQQQIATMNVLRGIPPQALNGKRIDISPIVELLVNNVFGSELTGKILIDDSNMFSVDPHVEDEMLHNGIKVMPHQADNDTEHIQVHQDHGRLTTDPTGLIRTHIQMHAQQLMAKRQKAMAQQQGSPGVPGGAGPGVPGAPRPGGQPNVPRPVQGPPGTIHPDQMPGQPGRG